VNPEFWRGKSVLMTGHTGFKGSWLALWLEAMGARVHGVALEPPTDPALFRVLGLAQGLASHTIADIRDLDRLRAAMQAAEPAVVLHLAAQSLVRESYAAPIETFSTNVLGTANLLEAARDIGSVRVIVNVTTDKCYRNREWPWPYRENDPLGGHDPYSSSKACAELVSAAYRDSFLGAAGIAVATARAGNVIGGGDWAADRLIPDFLRAVANGTTLRVRSPAATRPWQHVLEPLSGYLVLAERLWDEPEAYAEAWNFGPGDSDARTVGWVLDQLVAATPGSDWIPDAQEHPHEAASLRLDSSKARIRLGWGPRWPLPVAIARTLDWFRARDDGRDMRAFSLAQIGDYQAAAADT